MFYYNVYLLTAKQDLASFNPPDLILLAKHLNVKVPKNRQDLLWLLAITIHSKKRGEMPPNGGEIKDLVNLDYLSSLNDDMLFSMLSYANWQDILNLCRSSQDFNQRVCENKTFWHRLLSERFPEQIGSPPTEEAWKGKAQKINSDLGTIQEWLRGIGIQKTLRELESLQELDLSSNQLSSLPDTIGNLSSLQKLNLNGNQLSSLPDAIGDLRSLRKLNLSF